MRRALAGVVAVAVLAACSSGGDDDAADRDEDEPTRTPRPEVDEPELPDLPPFTEPADGGAVVVAEKGFSVFTGSEGEPVVSWGVVVENTSDQVATYTDVKVEPVDAGGVAVPMGSGSGIRRVETVNVLLPGQRLGFGQTEPLHGSGVADLRVEIGGSLWFPDDAEGVELAAVTASEVVVGEDIDFAVQSNYSKAVRVMATAVLRNAAGQVVGGTSRDEDASGPVGDEAPAGRSAGKIYILDAVPDVDPARVEVYTDVGGVAIDDEATRLAEIEPDNDGASGPAEFCGLFELYQLRNQAASAGGQDPRFALAPLAAIGPPQSIAAEWQSFYAWRWGVGPALAVSSMGIMSTPSPEISDDVSAVMRYWSEECVAKRGHDNIPVPFDAFDEPDDLPPFTTPENGEIRVVEQGFSPTADSSGSPQVTYGVIVENTSDQVATDVRVTAKAVGAAFSDYAGELTIPVLLPGQKYGLGETTYSDGAAMTGLEVTVEAAQWWPADHELVAWGEITTSDVTITRSPHGPYAVTFAIDSTYPVVRLGIPFQVVFRNASGQIVGGANDELFANVSPGRSFGEIYSNYPVPDVTDTATEVYV